jgi:hypothetical protein
MVCIKQNEPKVNKSLKGTRIEQVNRFTYLGSMINNDRRSEKEVKSGI